MEDSVAQCAVGGVVFEATNLDAAVEALITGRWAGMPIRLANTYCIALAHSDEAYATLLASPGVNLPDGAPVALEMRARGHATARQVRGPSFFEQSLADGRAGGLRHYLLGGSSESLARLVRTIDERYPGSAILGATAPPYTSDYSALAAALPATITHETTDVIWVGLGSPKQDFVAEAVAARTGVTTIGVGAAFDYVAGTVRQAPHWMRRSGLEWLFRLAVEPRRLFRRYLWGNTKYIAIVFRERISRRHQAREPS